MKKAIPFRQETRFGCTLHTLANLFNEPKFLIYIRPNIGGSIELLNEVLQKLEPEIMIQSLFVCSSKLDTQNRFLDKSLFDLSSLIDVGGELVLGHFKPYIITVVLGYGTHSILAIQAIDEPEKLIVFDSLRYNSIEYLIDDFLLEYHVTEVHHFLRREERLLYLQMPTNFLFINQDFQHLI